MKIINKKVLILIVLLIFIFFGVYYFAKINKNDNTINTTQNDVSNKNTIYMASVGKFRLDLPSKYAVIQNVDGQTQNGDRTVIEVGQYLSYTNNVVSSPNLGKAVITATPLKDKIIDELLELYVEDEKILSTQLIDIDGQQATYLVLDGDVQKDLYYFDNADILYVLYFENTDQSDDLSAQKEAILKGFTLIE